MAYRIQFEPPAREHLRELNAHDRVILLTAIHDQLAHQPTVATRHRKPLRPNPLASWELCVGDYRVFYDVLESESEVRVADIGRKQHGRLFIGGSEYKL